MAAKRGESYESLTQRVLDLIVNQKEVNTIKVQRDVQVQGITAKHQIDVYWEFERGGIKYITLVSAKDWASRVPQSELFSFGEILKDIPGQPKGVFVTKTGYQKGAFEYAKAHGIKLYVLREPTEADWEGRVKDVHITMHAIFPHAEGIELEPDEEWVKAETKRTGLSGEFVLEIAGLSDQLFLLDERGEQLASVYDIINSFYPGGREELPPTRRTREFTEPTFLETGDPRLPRMKIKSISATVSVSMIPHGIVIRGADLISHILYDIISGEGKFLRKDDIMP